MKRIVSFGGGTNSSAMLIGMVSKNIIPDKILFADTGGEKQETYDYIEYFSKWLVKNGMPEIEIVKYKTKDGIELTLEQDILEKQTLPAIAFGFKSCSEKFKIRPQARYIKERFPKQEILHYIGFDAGEQRRAKENPIKGHSNTYPLIDWGWNRERCITEIKLAGLCQPGKSSCFFCPNMKKPEILSLPSELKERVKTIELNAKNKVEMKGLGRQYSWTDLINSDQQQQNMFDDLEMYQDPCECID